MSKITIELDTKAIGDFLKSSEVQDMLQEEAQTIVNRAEGNYTTSVYVGLTRANASVITTDKETYKNNLKNNSLLRALG